MLFLDWRPAPNTGQHHATYALENLLLRDAVGGNANLDPEQTAAWWAERGAEQIEVDRGWTAESPEQLERILRIKFPEDTVDRQIAKNPG